MSEIRLGANYTPRRGWFHHWLDFDAGEVRADLADLAGLGLDHVRVFCLWPLFQPNRGLIRRAALDDLVRLVDAADEVGLDVTVDVLQGHLSSFDFLPAWTQTWHDRDLFADPDVSRAQAELVGAVTAALADHPAFLGTGVGNETNQFTHHDHPRPTVVTPTQVDVWLSEVLGAAEGAMPGGLHQHSFDDRVWFDDRSPITPHHATTHGAVTTVHSWVFMGAAQRYGNGHPSLGLLAAYLVELAAAWAVDPDRPVWLQEVGAPTPFIPSDDAAEFLDRTARQAAHCPELWGITWWCSHDVDRALLDFPELEYSLGLFTASGERKPAAERIAALAAELRDQAPPMPVERPAVVFDAEEPRSSTAPGSAVFDTWLGLALDGVQPAIVAAHRVGEPGYLARRGVVGIVSAGERV